MDINMAQTIAERAEVFAKERNACDTCDGGIYCPCDKFTADYDMYFKIATEQDCSARVEERERCINAAQIQACKFICMNFSCNLVLENDMCRINNCDTLKSLRKAIEEGSNNGNNARLFNLLHERADRKSL